MFMLSNNIIFKANRGLIMLPLFLMLNACSSEFTQYLSVTPESYKVQEYVDWLESADNTATLNELMRLELQNQETLNLIDTVQLALILSASAIATVDSENRALALLYSLSDDRLNNERSQDYFNFSELWKTILSQRRTLRITEQQQANIEQELLEVRSVNQALQEQINALTAIEQQLIERERPQASP